MLQVAADSLIDDGNADCAAVTEHQRSCKHSVPQWELAHSNQSLALSEVLPIARLSSPLAAALVHGSNITMSQRVSACSTWAQHAALAATN
jgi:hypothetical protein